LKEQLKRAIKQARILLPIAGESYLYY